MHDTLLIKNINVKEPGQRNVFFHIGDMDENRDTLMDLLNRTESPYYGRCSFRYNGIRMLLSVEEIPEVVRCLVQSGMIVYSVYEPYV